MGVSLGECSLLEKGCQLLGSEPQGPINEQEQGQAQGGPHAGLLEMDFGALALGCEAGDGPHLDLNARVELLVSHVPNPLDRGGDRFVLQRQSRSVGTNERKHSCCWSP